MIAIRLSVRRAGALAAFVVATLLAGCVTYPGSYYASDDRYGGDYYYGRDDGYYADPYWGVYAYDSIFWPTYRWYDPWYSPGYSYGVSFFPSWWGLSYGYYGGHHHHHHYSPYRGSWWDNRAYYGNADWRHGHRDGHSGRRFGSARNEAERIARAEGVARPQRDDTAGLRSYSPETYRGGAYLSRGSRSRGIDYGDRGAVPADNDPTVDAQRDAAWRADGGRAYSRYRSGDAPNPRTYDWRDSPRGEGAGPREIDARALGGGGSVGRPAYGMRRIDPSSDAHSRGRDPTTRYDAPTPRYAQPRYEQPRSSQPPGGMVRPASPPRSYNAPSMPSMPAPSMPSPRADSGGHSRGGSHRSREPD